MAEMRSVYHSIEVNDMDRLVELLERLLKKGLVFRVWDKDGWWLIELTGGY